MITRKKTNLTKRLALVLISFLLLAFSLLPITLAWFSAGYEGHNFEGEALLGYFESGDGSEETPYIIANAKHFYNLAWLQNIGAFENRTPHFKIVPEEGNTLNMAGTLMGTKNEAGAIPPIGTVDQPFVGTLDGNGVVIQNLWVSTDETDWYERPIGYTQFPSGSGIGLFGNVGFGANISNFFLENVEITATVDGDLGIIAGYVDGDISKIGVKNAKISFKDEKPCLISSDYSLVGFKEENVVWDDLPLEGEGEGGSGEGGSGEGGSGEGDGSGSSPIPGDDATWGGSVDMMDLNKRLSYIIGAADDVAKNDYSTYNYNHLNFVGIGSGRSTPYKTSGKVIYFSKDTLLPLNIDKDAMLFTDEKDGNNGSKTTEAYKSASQKETVSHTNTGYLVGGGSGTSSSAIRLRAYTITYGSYNGIYKSLGTAKVTNGTFDGANFEMLTVTPNGNTYVIQDPYNEKASTYLDLHYTPKSYDDPALGFTQYYKLAGETDVGVRSALVNTLQGEELFHGIHFMPHIDVQNLNTTTFDAQIFKKNTLTTLKNYEAIDGALNFTVSSAGTITAIAATNFMSSGTHSLFYLYQIERDPSSNAISTVTEIKTIHKNNNVQTGETLYAYNLVNADPLKYTLVYDSSTMNQLTEPGAAYYFEIPVNAGDYAIGCKSGDKAGAYLMYLDIGANGNAENEDSGEGGSGEGGGDDGGNELCIIPYVDGEAGKFSALNENNPTQEVSGAKQGYAYYVNAISYNNPNPQPESNKVYKYSGGTIAFGNNSPRYIMTQGQMTGPIDAETEIANDTKVIDPDFMKIFKDVNEETGQTESRPVKGLAMSSIPDFSNETIDKYGYPSNSIWFQPMATGECVIAFARTNNKADYENMSLYRYKRIGNYVDLSTLQEITFSYPKNNGPENKGTAYFALNLEKADLEYEYVIGRSTLDENNTSASASFIFLKMAGTNIIGGEGEGGEGGGEGGSGGEMIVIRHLNDIDFVESTSVNLEELEMHRSVLEIEGTQTGSGALYFNVLTYGNILYADESNTITLTQKVQTDVQATPTEYNAQTFPERTKTPPQAVLWNTETIKKRSLPPPRQRAFSLCFFILHDAPQ